MEILIKAVQLILSLAILVILHEFGHFISARIFKTRVEKFYLFFNPWFSLFKFKHKDTEYGVGWLPLGGYVKISGMIDESMDKEAMKQPPKPWEFRSKPAWQRLIIMLAGVIMNLILAIIIHIGMLTAWGEEYIPNSETQKYGIVCDSIAINMGLQNGDYIQSVNNQAIVDFEDIHRNIILDQAESIQIVRNGQEIQIDISSEDRSKLIKNEDSYFIMPAVPFEVGGFTDESPGKDAGLQEDDKIISINDVSTPFFQQFREEIVKHKDEKVKVGYLRKTDTLYTDIQLGSKGLIGIERKALSEYFDINTKEYNFLQAIPAGTKKTFTQAGNYLKSLKLLFTEDKAYESLGGFISIGKIFPGEWDWKAFWNMTAFLSIILAIMNVLPIPALDGGHVLFLTYEMITRRKPSDKFMEYAQVAGMIILIGLLLFANGNDIIKLFR